MTRSAIIIVSTFVIPRAKEYQDYIKYIDRDKGKVLARTKNVLPLLGGCYFLYYTKQMNFLVPSLICDKIER